MKVIDLQFQHGCAKPTFAVLYQDLKEARHVKTYELEAVVPFYVCG